MTADTPVEEVIRIMRTNELPGIPVVNDGGRCVGIVTETDMVLPDDDGDLHLPHYVNIFGGTVFLEPLRNWEDRLKKAFASTAKDMMSEDPTTVEPAHDHRRSRRDHPRHRPQPAAGGRARPPGRRGHARRRARRPRLGLGAMPERALARVSTGAIQANCRLLAERVGGDTALCAVVKADGYGHGAGTAARAALAGGAEWLAVATAARGGRAARRRASVVPILVMGALSADEADLALDNDADVVVWTRGFLESIAPRRPRVHVKLDTGMGRLGTADLDEARALVRAVDLDQDAEPGRRDDPLRHRRRAGRRPLPAPAGAVHGVRGRGARATTPA